VLQAHNGRQRQQGHRQRQPEPSKVDLNCISTFLLMIASNRDAWLPRRGIDVKRPRGALNRINPDAPNYSPSGVYIARGVLALTSSIVSNNTASAP